MSLKKAQIEWVVVVLLFLAVTLVVIGIVYKIKTATEKSVEKGICKLSVEKLALGKNIPVIGSQLAGAKIDCERENLVFKKSESQDEKNVKLAKAILNCVDNFWEGKKDFTESGLFEFSAVNCVICAKISFEEEALFHGGEYLAWSKQTPIPNLGKSYWEYFDGLNKFYNELNMGVQYLVQPIILSDPKKEYYLFWNIERYGSQGQTSKLKLESTDDALKNCENLLN